MKTWTARRRYRWAWLVVLVLGWVVPPVLASPLEVSLHGSVRDEGGKALTGIPVKVFVDGFLRTSAASAVDGKYSVSWSGEAGDDPTVVVWWVPATAGQVPEVVLLREGRRTRSLEIWGPCIPRLSARPDSAYDVVLYSEAEKLRLLRESDCMKSAPPVR